MILKYIYTGELDYTKQLGEDIIELLVASHELFLEELFEQIQNYLITKQISWVHEITPSFYIMYLNLIIARNYKIIVLNLSAEGSLPFLSSKAFLSINKEILFCLLQRDDIPIEEITFWDYLIKWGLEQTLGLENENNDKSKWNNENYEALKLTLNQFIPLIRFLEISRTGLFYKVYPCITIIPNNIYEGIERFLNKDALSKSITLSLSINFSIRIGKIQIKYYQNNTCKSND
ncbi:uncharacterized protein OCT59_012304 [Rhizophagus irregularis]|uniref:uncharacterized protein n=1 Tax=Rhizophagus irregularis TaxID=588596 RepID=UPI0019E31409|nr:hypothetical protein OCT59_012304 [Rhizophagus irregularis]GBC40208.2 hypothetical protein GLOIN_2v1762940 [Rhizophagus irregularis DAOM 181602=DAOM 197198]